MTFTLSSELLLSLLGQAVLIGIAWGLIRGELKSLRRELDEVKAHQASASETAILVTRLEERLNGFIEELKRQPALLGQVVAVAMREALRAAAAKAAA